MEWFIAEQAIFCVAGATVPFYDTLGPDSVSFVLEQTGARSVVCTRAELDRLCDALITIHGEIKAIESGEWSQEDNPLRNAPHTVADLMQDWNHAYSKEKALFPLAWVNERKFWPSVNRIDHVYGDKNLFCSCIPVDEYNQEV